MMNEYFTNMQIYQKYSKFKIFKAIGEELHFKLYLLVVIGPVIHGKRLISSINVIMQGGPLLVVNWVKITPVWGEITTVTFFLKPFIGDI